MKEKIINLVVFLIFTITIKAQTDPKYIETEHLPKINLTKDSLKILHIGNSFTNNSTSYLSSMVKAAGIDTNDMCLYKCIRGSGTFQLFLKCWNDKDTRGYSISKVVGGITLPVASSAIPYDGSNIRKAFTDCKWDIIIIQQVSSYSHKYSVWNKEHVGGHLQEFINLIRTYQPQAAIGVNLVHASYKLGNNTDSLFHLIADSYHQFCIDYGFDDILTSRDTGLPIATGGGAPKTGNGGGTPTIKPKKPSNSRRYVCPCCGAIVRSTRPVNIVCGDCNVPFDLT